MDHVGSALTVDQAMALFERGRAADAEAALRAIVAKDPADAEALTQLVGVLAATDRFADAEQAWTRALALRPHAPDLLYNLGLLHQLAGRHDAAIDCYRNVLAALPPSSDILVNLGNSYLALGRSDEAIDTYREAVRLDPKSVMALTNLARALMAAGRLAEPGDLLDQALGLQPHFIEARRGLAQIHELTGNISEAIAARRQVAADAPERADFHRELILALNFAEGDDGAVVAEACRAWHERFAAPFVPAPAPGSADHDPERPLRIGYIGGNQFRRHTLAHTMLPLVEAHGDRVQLTCYSDLKETEEDEISARFQRRMAWRRTGDLSDADYARAIAADHIDVIIDPLGFVGGSRLLALARRPAPIQVSFPVMGTCGGASIDYVLCDRQILPADRLRHYTERPLYVPFAYCYRPLEEPPALTAPPASSNGAVTFGSMNSLPKISPGAIRAWRRILDQVPNARLLVKAGFPFRDDEVRRRFLGRLESAGIDPDRVTLKDWVADHAGHLATYNEIDVALDSLPYNGVVTTYEALLMGVPVVTRTGARALDRYATSILRAVGFEDGIAADEDGYVARAVALAADRQRLTELRRTLRDRLLASPACDARLLASSIEQALRSAWRDYCARQH